MTWTDLHIVADVLLGQILWTAATELVFKPVVFWK